MKVSREYSSPNFSKNVIEVDFLVLHYTATDLAHTMEIFSDSQRGTCAHFVIDLDGTVHDLGGFTDGPITRGAHAGDSRVEIDGKTITTLNDRSIGIELVNFNGNIFDYTEAQYEALIELGHHLVQRFPKLREPGRVLGHEHIAGYRGKCDPGLKFDWPRVLKGLGAPLSGLHRTHAATREDLDFINEERARVSNPDRNFWSGLSSDLESRIRLRREF